MPESRKTADSQSTALTVFNVKKIQGKAVLTISNGDEISMPRAMLKERPYRSGSPFDHESFISLIRDRSYTYAMDKAVSLLALRSRTEKEIVDSLHKNAYPDVIIARVMQRLQEAGYIDDKAFARHWVSARSSKGVGTRRISYELRQKGVSQEDIEDVLSELETPDILSSAIQAAKKVSRSKDLSSYADQKKILAALARRGFDYSTARKALQEVKNMI